MSYHRSIYDVLRDESASQKICLKPTSDSMFDILDPLVHRKPIRSSRQDIPGTSVPIFI